MIMRALHERELASDPHLQFVDWFEDALQCGEIAYPHACCLSTVTPDGYPDGRIVLLKSHDVAGFVFYTNLSSAKGRALSVLPRAAMTFYWDPLGRQIRIQGDTERVSDEEADAYFTTRDRLSRLGAWASSQSERLASRELLEQRVEEANQRFSGVEVPRPPFWSGVRLRPRRYEFWQFGPNRLHDRFCYRPATSGEAAWELERLFP